MNNFIARGLTLFGLITSHFNYYTIVPRIKMSFILHDYYLQSAVYYWFSSCSYLVQITKLFRSRPWFVLQGERFTIRLCGSCRHRFILQARFILLPKTLSIQSHSSREISLFFFLLHNKQSDWNCDSTNILEKFDLINASRAQWLSWIYRTVRIVRIESCLIQANRFSLTAFRNTFMPTTH